MCDRDGSGSETRQLRRSPGAYRAATAVADGEANVRIGQDEAAHDTTLATDEGAGRYLSNQVKSIITANHNREANRPPAELFSHWSRSLQAQVAVPRGDALTK